jgi:hypothetical protein
MELNLGLLDRLPIAMEETQPDFKKTASKALGVE